MATISGSETWTERVSQIFALFNRVDQRFALSSRERFARSADDEAKAAKFAFAFAKRKAFAKRAEPSESLSR